MEKVLIFDALDHSYKVDGESLPSVTGILERTGFIDKDWFTAYSATRGTYTHRACYLYEAGTLDEAELDPALVGYLNAYKRFLQETHWTSEVMEKPDYHQVLRYAGTPDRVGLMPGRKSILDIKTGVPSEWHRFQTAGYSMILDPIDYNRFARFSLYLKSDGSYKLARYDDRNDSKIFLAALTVYNAQRRIGK